MTSILTLVSPAYVVQVSDRRVTLQGGSKEHDPVANKTVVYGARNAIATLGCSGIAYVENIPTDEWIVRALTDIAPDDPVGLGGLRFGWSRGDCMLDQAVHRLMKRLDGRLEPRKYGLIMTVAGWKTIKGRCYRFIDELEWGPAYEKGQRRHSPQSWFWKRDLCLGVIGAHASELLVKNLENCRQRDPSRLDIEQAEHILVQTVREVASRDRTVGQHVLSVILPNPNFGGGIARFIPASDHWAKLVGRDREIILTVAHTPWVVSGDVIYAPSVAVGDQMLELRGYQFLVVGAPAPENGILAISSGLDRQPPPGRPKRERRWSS